VSREGDAQGYHAPPLPDEHRLTNSRVAIEEKPVLT
jgi:hypothetical protein